MDGAFGRQGEWERLMASVRAVGVDAWLRAMPAEIIRPGAISGEIAGILREIPVVGCQNPDPGAPLPR